MRGGPGDQIIKRSFKDVFASMEIRGEVTEQDVVGEKSQGYVRWNFGTDAVGDNVEKSWTKK